MCFFLVWIVDCVEILVSLVGISPRAGTHKRKLLYEVFPFSVGNTEAREVDEETLHCGFH